MKTTKVLFSMAFGLLAATAKAEFTIDWFTLDGGGGTNNPATVPATLPARFFRLFKP